MTSAASAHGYDDLRGRLLAMLITVEDRLPASTRDFITEELDANELGLALEVMVEALAERQTPVEASLVSDLQGLANRMEMDLDVGGALPIVRELDPPDLDG